jgi:uncharacterized protein YndB with AHSA1/START domain
MIRKVLLSFALAIALFALVVSFQPKTYHVERTTTIAAPPAAVFAIVNDFHHFGTWSPWASLDPAMKQQISGSPAGVGSVYSWSGNDKAGEGKMTITRSEPDRAVGIDLAFTRPYASTSTIELALKPEGAGTSVTWSMNGESNFMLKAIGLFSSMDKMVGPDFEKGLGQLKTVAEAKR